MLSVLRSNLCPRTALIPRSQACRIAKCRSLGLFHPLLDTEDQRSTGQRSVMAGAISQANQDGISYLTQKDAVALDEDLMGPLGFSVDQLMELAGLSVACAVAAEAPAPGKVLVMAGPGNNGGDGLVAARHLHHFGYHVEICYPKPTNKPLYNGLVVQCKSLQLPFIEVDHFLEDSFSCGQYGVIIDSLFGFSFKGAPRPPFDKILEKISECSTVAEGPLVASVDIPSGWNVESGPGGVEGAVALRPNMLISLTTPKLCARFFEGEHHYLGGRFVPPEIRTKYNLRLPPYPGTSMCVKLPTPGETENDTLDNTQKPAITEMGRHAADDDYLLDDQAAKEDPIILFEKWFSEAAKDDKAANAVALATVSQTFQPAARMVLMKGFDAQGFTVFTNYNSRKAQELDGAQKAALCFYWKHLNRSVRVEGHVERIPGKESDEYFATRPRGSQLGAWTSAQSTEIQDRKVLRDEYARLEKKYEGVDPIPRPPHWGGYRITPLLIEFWHDQSSRMHDRLEFTRADDTSPWTVKRLSP